MLMVGKLLLPTGGKVENGCVHREGWLAAMEHPYS